MEVVDNDYLRYIMHVEALQPAAAEPDLDRAVYAAAEDPVAEAGALASALLVEQGANVAPQIGAVLPAPEAGGNGAGGNGSRAKAQVKRPNAPDPDASAPIVKQQHEKVGRNDPCWCGSGKKFKFCHGAA